MVKILKYGILLGVLSCLFLDVNIVEAKRGIPPEPSPTIYKGIKFVASHWPRHEKVNGEEVDVWYVEGWDVEKNVKVWETEAYKINIDNFLEYDVQMVFITSLSVENDKLIVINEKGKKYRIDLPQNYIKRVGALNNVVVVRC